MKISNFLQLSTVILLACSSCTGNKSENIIEKDKPEIKLSFEQRIDRHVTGSLSIPPTEKFTTSKYMAHLNADNFEDAIITVNRLDHATKQSVDVPNGKQIAEMGYMGNYNYFIYYDGKLDRFSVPVPVASSTNAPLKVKFENLISSTYKDFTIEYRIMNSAYKNYYLVDDGILHKIFQLKLYDYLGTDKSEVFYIEYDKGSISNAQDILVYEGKIKNDNSKVKNIYTFEPEITKSGKLLFRWFYNPKTMQYMTQNVEALRNN